MNEIIDGDDVRLCNCGACGEELRPGMIDRWIAAGVRKVPLCGWDGAKKDRDVLALIAKFDLQAEG